MFTKLLIKLGLKEDPKVVLEKLLAEVEQETFVKVIPAKKKPVSKKPAKKKAPVKKKAAKKAK